MTRRSGCLWVLGLFIALIILLLMFGGFQKGIKVGAGAQRPPLATSLSR
jgi:hypothetical protein